MNELKKNDRWKWVYNRGTASFYEVCEKVGLAVNLTGNVRRKRSITHTILVKQSDGRWLKLKGQEKE